MRYLYKVAKVSQLSQFSQWLQCAVVCSVCWLTWLRWCRVPVLRAEAVAEPELQAGPAWMPRASLTPLVIDR